MSDNGKYKGDGRISPQALADLRRRVGVMREIEHPFTRHVNPDSIRHAALAVAATNKLYFDEAYAGRTQFGGLVAHPALLYGVTWGSWDMRRGDGLPGVHALHGSDEWFFHRPLKDGDRLSAKTGISEVREAEGEWAGRTVWQTRRNVVRNQGNEHVATQFIHMVRGEARRGRERGKHAAVQRAHYTPEQIEEIDQKYLQEEARGEVPRFIEDTRVGEEVGPMIRGPFMQADMIVWRMAMGGGHLRSGRHWVEYRRRTPAVAIIDELTGVPETVARVHWSEEAARRVGMPAPYDFGAQRGGWFLTLLTNWSGDAGWLMHAKIAYKGPLFIGDLLTLTGEVQSVCAGGDAAPYGVARISVSGANQDGRVIIAGEATVALPRKPARALAFPLQPGPDLAACLSEDVRREFGGQP